MQNLSEHSAEISQLQNIHAVAMKWVSFILDVISSENAENCSKLCLQKELQLTVCINSFLICMINGMLVKSQEPCKNLRVLVEVMQCQLFFCF